MPSGKSLYKLLCAALLSLVTAFAVAQQKPSYGPAVTIDDAKKMAAGALAEAKKNNWNVAIAIVDNHGLLVYYEKMDDTQTASADIAIDKARSAAMFRRSTKVFEDVLVTKGRTAVLALRGATPVQGGLQIMANGRTIGGIGVSGVASDQDEQIAQAGLNAMK
jgi:glc operon protein GlcG